YIIHTTAKTKTSTPSLHDALPILPKHELRYYQKEIVDALCDAKHGAVEVGTGLGKSKCILHQTKRLGVQTLIMAPSTSIARQLRSEEHTSELQSRENIVCRLLLEK